MSKRRKRQCRALVPPARATAVREGAALSPSPSLLGTGLDKQVRQLLHPGPAARKATLLLTVPRHQPPSCQVPRIQQWPPSPIPGGCSATCGQSAGGGGSRAAVPVSSSLYRLVTHHLQRHEGRCPTFIFDLSPVSQEAFPTRCDAAAPVNAAQHRVPLPGQQCRPAATSLQPPCPGTAAPGAGDASVFPPRWKARAAALCHHCPRPSLHHVTTAPCHHCPMSPLPCVTTAPHGTRSLRRGT